MLSPFKHCIKKKKDFVYVGKIPFHSFYYGIVSFCAMCYKMEHVECHEALHYPSPKKYPQMTLQTNSPMEVNCTALTKDVL